MVSSLQVLLKSSSKASKSLIRKAMVIFPLVNYAMVRNDCDLVKYCVLISVLCSSLD